VMLREVFVTLLRDEDVVGESDWVVY
jgi:hypothetical protein